MLSNDDLDNGLQRGAAGLDDYAWAVLADHVRSGNFTLVVGPLLSQGIVGSREDIARRWVRDSRLPVREQAESDLAQVAQYVRVRDGDGEVRTQLQWVVTKEPRRRRDELRRVNPVWDLEDWLVAGADPSQMVPGMNLDPPQRHMDTRRPIESAAGAAAPRRHSPARRSGQNAVRTSSGLEGVC